MQPWMASSFPPWPIIGPCSIPTHSRPPSASVLAREGVDAKDPADPGGRTRFDISQRAHKDVDVPSLGKQGTDDGFGTKPATDPGTAQTSIARPETDQWPQRQPASSDAPSVPEPLGALRPFQPLAGSGNCPGHSCRLSPRESRPLILDRVDTGTAPDRPSVAGCRPLPMLDSNRAASSRYPPPLGRLPGNWTIDIRQDDQPGSHAPGSTRYTGSSPRHRTLPGSDRIGNALPNKVPLRRYVRLTY